MRNSVIFSTLLSCVLSQPTTAHQHDTRDVNWNDPNLYNQPFFQAFVGPPLLSARLDPIINPNQPQSAHVHDFFGGGGLAADWKYDKAVQSGCTGVAKKMDFSNYWFPALYHQAADGTFTKVKSELRLYYHWDGQRQMFPHGFKMITGNPFSRKDDGTNPVLKDLKWTCNKQTTPDAALPANVGNCGGPDGLVAKIHFPSCMKPGSTGDAFDPKNPSSQTAFPTDGFEGTQCPQGYVLLPSIMLEIFFHDVQALAAQGSAAQAFTFAHGDTTGYGFHADFVNGWVDGQGGLSSAVSTQCKEGFGGNMCVTPGGAGTCSVTQGLGGGENAQNPGKQLLGCNPLYPATSACQSGGSPQPSAGTTTTTQTKKNTKREEMHGHMKVHKRRPDY